jgi:hypothetical protein
MLAPIVIYTYNRIEHLKKTVNSLKENFLASESILIIISDGCSRETDEISINKIREYIETISGFKEVIKEYRQTNYGPIGSAMEAERRLINQYGKLIVLEDDNICSKNFLDFMNQGLNHFENDSSVFSISGYCPPVGNNLVTKSSYYRYYWNLSWGFGIWKRKYNQLMDLNNDFDFLIKTGTVNKLNSLGGQYIVDALKRDIKYKSDFPDAWVCAKMTYFGYSSIVPVISKVLNIGSDGSGHHKSTLQNKFFVSLDQTNTRDFDFNIKPENNEIFNKRMISFYSGSIFGRVARYFGIYHYVLEIKKIIS